jgi:hypothetical protein
MLLARFPILRMMDVVYGKEREETIQEERRSNGIWWLRPEEGTSRDRFRRVGEGEAADDGFGPAQAEPWRIRN